MLNANGFGLKRRSNHRGRLAKKQDYVIMCSTSNPHDTYIIYYMCVIARVIDVITGPSMLEKQFQICSHKMVVGAKHVSNMFNIQRFPQHVFLHNTFLKTVHKET